MSNEMLEITDKNGRKLYVTSYCGENGDKSIQLTVYDPEFLINYRYVSLSSNDIKKLITVLQERLGD